jgi:KaiC/GvpD/RAD55 family RecA-like ATPase
MKSGDHILNPIDASRHAAQLIANRVPDALFCGFGVSTKDGKTRKQPLSLCGPGVGVDTPHDQLIHGQNLPDSVLPMGASYWGVVMQKRPYIQNILGEDFALVILDLDTKNSTAPRDIRIEKLLNLAREQNLLTERSHSQKGGHIMFLAPAAENLPKKIKLGNHQEIEVFGLSNSAGKSVMLTGDKMRGDILPIDSLIDLLHQAGITDDVIFPPEPAPTTPAQPAEALFTAPRPMDEMDRAEQALSHISIAKGDYETWIEMGMALQKGFGESGFPLWVNWSAAQPEFKGEEDCRTHWKSFKPNGRTSLGTLFHLAKSHGYTPPTKATERRSAVEDFASVIQAAPQDPIFPTIDDPQSPKGWQELDFDVTTLEPIDFLIDGFISHSFSVIAGQPGVGKTTAMLSIALTAAGFQISDSPLKCEARRKIIYVSEDTAQIRRSLYAYCANFNLSAVELKDWFILIESKRSDVAQVLELAHNVMRHTHDNERPWLIIDTANATLDIENENDNSEVGAYMAALKQTIYTQLSTSIAIITHTSKTISREDDSAMARGASAFTGDATLTAVFFQDETKNRYMRLSKTRYEPTTREVRFDTHMYSKPVVNRHGNLQELNCVTVVPHPSSEEHRQELKAEIKDQKRSQQIMDKADEAYAYIQTTLNAHPTGVIVKKGSGGSPNPPDTLNQMHVLSWADVLSAVPGSSDGALKRDIKDAVFARLVLREVGKSWFQIG